MDADLPTGTETIAICAPDNAGRLIGKRIPAGRWGPVLAAGLPMPDFHLITGIENVPLTGLTVTGQHRGFPNGVLRPCPETMCRPGWEPGSALVISDVADADGRLVEQAPRSILKRQVARLQGRRPDGHVRLRAGVLPLPDPVPAGLGVRVPGPGALLSPARRQRHPHRRV